MKKKLDKKTIIAICVAAVALVAVIVAVAIGVGGNNDDENTTTTTAPNEQQAGYNEEQNSNVDGNEEDSTGEGESESQEDESNEEQSNQDGNNDTQNGNDGGSSSNGGSNVPTTNNNNKNDGAGNGTPDVGAGNANDPYMEFPNDSMKVKTVSIGAGKVVNYGIYRVAGMYMTINDADAYVIIDGKKYSAKNGKVSVMMPDGLASDAIMMEIGNNGSKAKAFTLSFSYPKGTYDNPMKIDDLDEEFEISLSAGEEMGYFYEYKAEKNGVMRFYIKGYDSKDKELDTIIRITNNRNSAQRSNEVEEELKVDEDGNAYVELEVKKGDEISINVSAKPNKRGKVPAIDIVWSAKYE